MSAWNCSTCAYRDECADRCIGYVEDEETAAARADYEELKGELERDERGGED